MPQNTAEPAPQPETASRRSRHSRIPAKTGIHRDSPSSRLSPSPSLDSGLRRNDEGGNIDRLSHAKNFANELSESRLREIAETYRRRWTPEARALKAKLIQSIKPWTQSTGPQTQRGKARSRLNGDKRKGRTLAMRIAVKALKVQSRFLTRLNRAIRYKNPPESFMNDLMEEGRHATACLVLANALWLAERHATPCC